MSSRFILLIITSLVFQTFTALADDWAAPEPVSFAARGFGYVAEIFPSKSRQNQGNKPVCYLYQMGYQGTTWEVNAKLISTIQLVNEKMPYQAVLSVEGDLVTLNEYGTVGSKHAVVIYAPDGKLVKDFQLSNLISEEEIRKFTHSTSSIWWNESVKYYFLRNPKRFYIVFPKDKVLEFTLEAGQSAYGKQANFPELSRILGKFVADEEAEIWQTSLRFSSITDLKKTKR